MNAGHAVDSSENFPCRLDACSRSVSGSIVRFQADWAIAAKDSGGDYAWWSIASFSSVRSYCIAIVQ